VDPVLGYKTAFNNLATKISGIQARIARQTNELATIKAQKARLIDVGVNIDDLKRAIVSDEQVLKSLEATIVQSSLDQVTNPDRISNISITETPTPPILEVKKFSKLIGGIAVSGVALGLMLAFVLETLVDHSLRRPQEVVSKLPFPLFVSVPYLNGKSKWGVFNMGDRKSKLLLKAGAETGSLGGAETKVLAPASAGPVVPWMENPGLQPYHETLRDRLIAYFEMINLTHKPKLVAVTGCHNGAGVSTVASGLASSLSETGEGNVLLVNMSSGDGEAHHFYKGKLNMGLDDILDKEKEHRETALVQDNLYVVQETSNRDKLPSVMPKRFGHLVTQLKASDYDYIIFDMPPVTQISVTPRLARFMDMVMLVVESEKTDRDAAQRAAALLSESRSHVGVVMNKSRSYMPRQLQHEI
jgi:Mrp family chromosome partitioning ATPase